MKVSLLLTRTGVHRDEARHLDFISLLLLALSLAILEIGLKDAPKSGWLSGWVLALMAMSVSSGAAFIWRMLTHDKPIVDLRAFNDWNFALGCALRFVLGIGLYGSVYLMPVFLGFVRAHDALGIGQVVLVTGAAQLATAPVAVWLELRVNARLLCIFGFILFAIGLAMSMYDTPKTDFDDMLWPQIVRGSALMFCLLAPTRIALGHLAPARVPDASALFNLMRNLGGAIGIALIDTVMFGRAEKHALMIRDRLEARDREMFEFTGLPFVEPGREISQNMIAFARPIVEKAGLTIAITEAWMMLAALTVLGIVISFAVRPILPDEYKSG